MYYYKVLLVLFFISVFNTSNLRSQGNCLLYPENSGERLACELSYRALNYRQGSKESQHLFYKAIEIGPKYAWAYFEKSVPFFKRGMFAEGMTLINKAIELEPKNYLYYRAYYYFYNWSYEYCIRDLEELYSVHKETFKTTPGGELEMRLLLAMAYAQEGKLEKGIKWTESLKNTIDNRPQLKGLYDHFCFGLLYFLNGEYDKALSEFNEQILIEDNFADTYYFIGQIHKIRSNFQEAHTNIEIAHSKILRKKGGYSMNIFGPYNTFLKDIENEMNLN